MIERLASICVATTDKTLVHTRSLITDYTGPFGQERISKIADSKMAQLKRNEPVIRQHNYSGDAKWVRLPLQSETVLE